MAYYRLYLLDERSKFSGVRGIVSEDEEGACQTASLLSEGLRWELWQEKELIRCGKGDTIYPRGERPARSS